MIKFFISIFLFLSLSFSQSLNFDYRKHLIQSAVFPGLGEYKIGEIKRAKKFFFTESTLILISIQTHLKIQRIKSNMESFSANHANVIISNKNDKFILDITKSLSTNIYNENQQRLRNSNEIYIDERYQWKWDEAKNMTKFYELNMKKSHSKKILFFTFGAMISNRIISMIDVNYLNNLNKPNLKLSFQSKLFSSNISKLKLIYNF